MKIIGKWFLLVLSVFFLGDNLKILLGEFTTTYVFMPYYLLMAVLCAVSAYYLASDLKLLVSRTNKQPIQSELSSKKIESGRTMTELDLFVVYNRDLLDKHIANRSTSIELHNGYNLSPGKFSLICKKNDTSNYEAKIFANGSKTEVPYDQNNLEHQQLYNHLRLMLENYRSDETSSKPQKNNIVPIRRH